MGNSEIHQVKSNKSQLLTAYDLDLPFDRVYDLGDGTFVCSIVNKYTIAARDGKRLRVFYPEYFDWLVKIGEIKLLDTNSPTE